MSEARPSPRSGAGGDVPVHDALTIRSREHRYCVAVFALNEGERLLGQLDRIATLRPDADVIVADGGSTDGSTALELMAARRVSVLLTKRDRGGLSAQMRMAIAFILDAGYDGMVVMDGNGKDDPRGIELILAALADGADHVQGSRYLPGGRGINTPRSRHLGVRLLHAPLVSLASGRRYTDTTNGFRGYSARLLTDPRVAPLRSVFDRYQLHYYLAIRAARLGFDVREVPVTRTYPASGPIPTKISPVRGNISILVQLLEACTGRFNPRGGAGDA
ncbi:MAG: glycosyltransferase family 2 protein [Chloroflexota bacterium]